MPLLDLKYFVAHTYSHTSQVCVGLRRDSRVDRFRYCQGLCAFPGFTQCRVCAALLAIWVSDVFFLVNSSISWECRWCAENFHKKLLPFLAERFVAKIAFHRHGCFQQRVLSSNHVQNCLLWSWKQLFEASRFPSMKPWMIQDIWEEYPTMNICTSVKVSGKCYEGSMLTTLRSSKNSWRGHWRLRVSINLHSVLPQIKNQDF